MTAIINQQDLLKSLEALIPVTKGKSPLPILKNVALIIDQGTSEIYATNLELYVKCKILPDQLESPFSTTVNAEKLNDILRNLRQDIPVEIKQLDMNRIALFQPPSTQFTLNTLQIDDFPSIPNAILSEDAVQLEIPPTELLEAIEAVNFAASDEASRFNLSSILITSKDKLMTFVATDGHRLAFFQLQKEFILPESHKGFLVPKTTTNYLLKWLSRFKDEQIKLILHPKSATIESAEYYISARLVDSDYPDYTKVIPSYESGHQFSVDKADLMQATRRVGLITSDRNKGINVNYEKGSNLMALSAKNPELGESSDIISIEPEKADSFDLIINKDYLMDSLSSLKSQRIFVSVDDNSARPVVFKTGKETNNLALVMPMRK